MSEHSIRDVGKSPRPEGEAAPREPLVDRLRRLPPGVVLLTIAAVLSLGFLLIQLASRTASVEVLTSAALVAGLIYVGVAAACGRATWRLGKAGRMWPALFFAFLGGCAAIGAALAFAGALVLFLALGF